MAQQPNFAPQQQAVQTAGQAVPAPNQPAQQAAPNQGQAAPFNQEPNNMDKGIVDPNGNANSANPQQQESTTTPNPLDNYSAMLDNGTKAEDNTPKAPVFELDPTRLNEVASNLNFSDGIPQDLMQKALTGDTQSLMEVINGVARNAYTNSLNHAAALTDTHVKQSLDYQQQNLGSAVKTELTSNELSSNPAMANPLVKSQLTQIAQQMSKAYPDAPPAEIAKMSQQYLQDMAQVVVGKPEGEQTTEATKASEVTDWGAYLST